MAVIFTTTEFNIDVVKADLLRQIDPNTELTRAQKQDCREALDSVPAPPANLATYTGNYIFTGSNGFKVTVFYYYRYERDINSVEINIQLTIDPNAGSTGTTSTTTSTTTTTTTTTPPPVTPWTPPVTPALPAQGALSANFTRLDGISVILPTSYVDIDTSNNVLLNKHYLNGILKVTNLSSVLRASVRNATAGAIPTYTVAELFINGSMAVSGYSINGLTNITLYYPLSTTLNNTVVSFVITTYSDSATADWIPQSTLELSGTGRFINGSCRGYIAASGAVDGSNPKYDLAMTASGCVPGTYVERAAFLNSLVLGQAFQESKYFNYTFQNTLSTNPLYGYIIPASGFTGTGGAFNGVWDSYVEVTVTPALTSTVIPFKIYTPYTTALTGTPVWIQTVLPDSNACTAVMVDWKDNTVETYTNSLCTELYFAHNYAAEGTYNTSVTGSTSAGNFVAEATFNIIDTYSTINIEDYKNTLGVDLILPYSRDEVNIGSNEWAVNDNINAAYNKIVTNFNYLNNITNSIKKTTDFTLSQWLRDLVAFPVWNTSLSGSNSYFSAFGSYSGIIPAERIVDFKSYKNGLAAPNYNNYYAFDTGTIQIRKNNYNNTLINQITAVATNSEPIKVYSIDVDSNYLYILASLKPNSNIDDETVLPVSVFRYYIGNASNFILPVNQVGGGRGNRADNNNFYVAPGKTPNNIRVIDGKVYVGDVGNRCIKVYNTALTHINTIYSSDLSAYDVLQFDVDPVDNNVYILGRIGAPNKPVLTSVILSAESEYRVTWNHDGERLNAFPDASANFNVYGTVEGAVSSTLIDSISSNYNNLALDPKLTTYVFTTSAMYSSFEIEAIGIDGFITSGKSSSKVIPNDVKFPSPYKFFVYSTSGTLLSSYSIPDVPSTATIKKIVIDPTNTFLYVITADYIYKYTSVGLYFINRMLTPSKTSSSLGLAENIVTGYIDDDYYFYLVTTKRIFKYTDIPQLEEIVSKSLVESYYYSISASQVQADEFIVDWVYNKALKPLLYNHEVLAKSINKKYVVTFDGSKNLQNFTTRELSANELINTLSANDSNFVYSNEIVSSAVINRTLEKIYDIQEAILNVLKPEVIITSPSYTNNILGKVTSLMGNPLYNNIVYQYVEPEPTTTTTTTTIAPLPVLFTCTSALYVGNVYSSIYGGKSRYGNNYIASFSLINATSACVLTIDLRDKVTSNFADPVYVTVTQNSNIIYVNTISTSGAITIPLSSTLTTDSAIIEADGVEGTYGANFAISLSLGSTTSISNVKPQALVTTSDGKLYNITFRNGLMNTVYPDCSLEVYNVSGEDIPFVGIANYTLGGYLASNPYAQHTWSIDGSLTATNPKVNYTPTTSASVQLSAVRSTQGESDLLLAFNRTQITAPATPYYALTINSTETYGGQQGAQPGGGHSYGSGSYPGGTIANVTAIATYGSFGRWAFNTNVFLISGAGTNRSWVSGPTPTNVANQDNGGRYDGTIFMDGDKTIDIAYWHR